MDVQRASTRVMLGQHVLDFADSEHSALYYSFDVVSLLRMDHLVVTVF